MKEFRDNLKRIRTERGMSQAELGKHMGYTLGNIIGYYERGERIPGIGALASLCKALDVTPNDLMGWDE